MVKGRAPLVRGRRRAPSRSAWRVAARARRVV